MDALPATIAVPFWKARHIGDRLTFQVASGARAEYEVVEIDKETKVSLLKLQPAAEAATRHNTRARGSQDVS